MGRGQEHAALCGVLAYRVGYTLIRPSVVYTVGFYRYMRDHVEQELSVFDSNVKLDAGWMHM